ncbi:MAG: MBOAT family protein [Bacteroidales bacterium]|nr:MBOAT family protein [Bacteroidales bacterium]
MTFNSFVFWLAFPCIFLIHWLLPDKISIRKTKTVDERVIRPRNVFLIIVSYLLYANWKPSFLFILVFITLSTFWGAKYVASFDRNRKRAFVCVWSLIILSPLLVFKYYNFINESVWSILSSLGVRYELHGLNWAIPIGISFYSFQALGYFLDVYYGRTTVERSFIDYVLFISFFPQIFSGPISKAKELLPQIKQERKFYYQEGVQGLKFILWGMFLKLVLADRLGLYVDKVISDYEMYSGGTCILAAVFYSIQIYGDFAGYSYMAVGVSKTLGFNLVNNFMRPYFSVSITDFWRRWHISLSRWLKDYIYIPLGGSRCSKLKNFWNIFITFLVSGIWHGANWTYIVWGIIHGVAQIIEKALGLNKVESKGVIRLIRIVGTFIVVTSAWVFFRMPTIGDAFHFIRHSFSELSLPSVLSVTNFAIYLIAIAIVVFKETREEFFSMRGRFFNLKLVRWMEYVVAFCLILLCGALDSGSFIYGSF